MGFNFFKKDYSHFLKLGDRMYQEERYAEARHEYSEALERLPGDAPGEARVHLHDRLSSTGNELARLNLREAAHALQRGDVSKAMEHAELALEQAEDEGIRGNAMDFQSQIAVEPPSVEPAKGGHSCASCSTPHHSTAATSELSADFMTLHERFELLIQPMPGNLSQRYRQMGERFASAYIAIHEDRIEDGYRVFEELATAQQSDILDYEIALIHFQTGKFEECERLLRSAIAKNPDNPLCHLGLVQLMFETGRYPESVPMLEHMIAADHLADQALIMLGDVLMVMGDQDAALERYIAALNIPSVAKTAAQKLVPVLEELGRSADAQAVAKRYLKGCC